MKHIAVLMGGLSAEREVSLTSGGAVALALVGLGYEVTQVDVGRDVAQVLAELKPDLAFNALHGTYGEDGCIQGVLETLNIPYTHSGVLASSLAMHKPMARHIFASVGLRCADGQVLTTQLLQQNGSPFGYPLVVKPIADGSSVGVAIIQNAEQLVNLANAADEALLVERYIAGREIQVAVLDDEPLGAIEIRTGDGFYDYDAKYTDGGAEHIMPAPLSEADYDEVMGLALKAHQALGCSGLTRTDFRYDDTSLGEPLFYILEVNTQPGMTPLSLAPEIAAHKGMSFATLVQKLVDGAKCSV